MTLGTMMFRRAATAAAPAALHVACWQEIYAGILPTKMLTEMSVDVRAAMWSGILDDPVTFGSTAVHVAEDEGRMIGFGACGRQRDKALADAGFTGEFGAIYVLRSDQECGVGRSLMSAMARSLLASGHMTACLWVLRENDSARAFHDTLGGRIVGEKADEQGGHLGRDSLWMAPHIPLGRSTVSR